jgi:hypothetical protein
MILTDAPGADGIELSLEDDLRESLEVIAEISGLPLEGVITMACSRYVEHVNQNGFPLYCGIRLVAGAEEDRKRQS